MPDIEILKIANKENRLVITMDKDFGELVYNSGISHSGVLLLRLENEKSAVKIKVLSEILTEFGEKLMNNFSVYHNNKLRIRFKSV